MRVPVCLCVCDPDDPCTCRPDATPVPRYQVRMDPVFVEQVRTISGDHRYPLHAAPPPPGRPVERTRGHEEDERE